jgi:hemoglobin
MQQVHAGHQYTNTEFNAIVADLIKAMERKKIPVATQNQLLSVLAPSYGDVVYH